ncbi:M48 family metallopeptidase [Paludifilum halophilum]|uniref:Zinc metalloprotease n=1 Tax=Paludifilum halophilum TaxID=1642702 RepID=A0A235B4Q2_9BACL|nr:SprT family zinc-dependent metalloprotease [Paludifilum halophilum]OYD07274.1 zinc metalloprotease [Paludifilum halophilum]
MPTLQYGTSTIRYTLQHKPGKKDVSIIVEWQKGVQVVAPQGTSPSQIDAILQKKAAWILHKQCELDEIQTPHREKEFVSGEKFPYLGRKYRLKVHRKNDITKPSLVFRQGRFTAEVPGSFSYAKQRSHLRALFVQWYRSHAEKKIKQRLRLYTTKLGVTPSRLTIKEQQARWGSCTKNGTILINWKLILAPIHIVDYVLVHELTHLKHPNHSKVFWETLRSILPDYEKRKDWLRVHGPELNL